MDYIDETISASAPLSRGVEGRALAPYTDRGERKTAALQLIPATDADFEVRIEGGIATASGTIFTTIGTYTQNSDSLMSIFEVSKSSRFRFRHISGPDIRVIMKG